MTNLKFEKEPYGATVATIFEDENTIVEVQERNDGVYGLIVHRRNDDTDVWHDLTAYLKPEHFEALGKVADHMRGSSRHAAGSFAEFHNRLRKLLNIDQHELIEAGVMTADDTEQWLAFQRDPWRWFIRADDHRAGLVWKIMEGV